MRHQNRFIHLEQRISTPKETQRGWSSAQRPAKIVWNITWHSSIHWLHLMEPPIPLISIPKVTGIDDYKIQVDDWKQSQQEHKCSSNVHCLRTTPGLIGVHVLLFLVQIQILPKQWLTEPFMFCQRKMQFSSIQFQEGETEHNAQAWEISACVLLKN